MVSNLAYLIEEEKKTERPTTCSTRRKAETGNDTYRKNVPMEFFVNFWCTYFDKFVKNCVYALLGRPFRYICTRNNNETLHFP